MFIILLLWRSFMESNLSPLLWEQCLHFASWVRLASCRLCTGVPPSAPTSEGTPFSHWMAATVRMEWGVTQTPFTLESVPVALACVDDVTNIHQCIKPPLTMKTLGGESGPAAKWPHQIISRKPIGLPWNSLCKLSWPWNKWNHCWYLNNEASVKQSAIVWRKQKFIHMQEISSLFIFYNYESHKEAFPLHFFLLAFVYAAPALRSSVWLSRIVTSDSS